MKIWKTAVLVALGTWMCSGVGFAEGTIPGQVFTNLSVVIDRIEAQGNAAAPIDGGLLTDDVTSGFGSFEELIAYTRDRNHAQFTLKVSGVESKDIRTSEERIEIVLPRTLLDKYLIAQPVQYYSEKNDRLVRSISVTDQGDEAVLELLLMPNVSHVAEETGAGVTIQMDKITSSVPHIVIDPGHGGKDPGTTSQSTKVQEKELALRTGLLLQEELVNRGYQVTMTRDSDWYPELRDRSGLANELDADVFLSIHYNSASNSASGIETFAYNTSDNTQLAEPIQRALIASTGATNRGVKNGNRLIVLNTTKVPAALLELGFLSNATEAKRVLDSAYQQTMVKAIANGLDAYFGR